MSASDDDSTCSGIDRWLNGADEGIAAIDAELAGDTPPAVLYHYTNAGGLDGIVRDKALWMTHSDYLNDPAEMTELRDAFLEACRSGSVWPGGDGFTREVLADVERHQREAASENSRDHTFIASFVERGDDLDLWRAYGADGSGYALGIRTTSLRCHQARLARVRYGRAAAREAIRKFLGACCESWTGDTVAHRDDRFRGAISMYLSLGAPFFKSDRYAKEGEWRLAMKSDGLMPWSRIRGAAFVPTHTHSIESSLHTDNPFAEVVCGPATDRLRAPQGVRTLLGGARVNCDSVPGGVSVWHPGNYYRPSR